MVYNLKHYQLVNVAKGSDVINQIMSTGVKFKSQKLGNSPLTLSNGKRDVTKLIIEF
jgi:hypothetical protein